MFLEREIKKEIKMRDRSYTLDIYRTHILCFRQRSWASHLMGYTWIQQTDPLHCWLSSSLQMIILYLPQGQCGRTECSRWSQRYSCIRDILPWSGGTAGPWSRAGYRLWMSRSPPCRSCIGSSERQSQSSRWRTQKSGLGSYSPRRRWSREKDTNCVCVRLFPERVFRVSEIIVRVSHIRQCCTAEVTE